MTRQKERLNSALGFCLASLSFVALPPAGLAQRAGRTMRIRARPARTRGRDRTKHHGADARRDAASWQRTSTGQRTSDGARPTILVRTPYNKAANQAGDPNAKFFASQRLRGGGAGRCAGKVRIGRHQVPCVRRRCDGLVGHIHDWIDQATPGPREKSDRLAAPYLGEEQIIAWRSSGIPRTLQAIAQALRAATSAGWVRSGRSEEDPGRRRHVLDLHQLSDG